MALGMLGKYERLDVLGHGTSGIVYLAKDTLLGRMVALKEVAAQGDDKERVLGEARVLDRLRHPNIVQVAGVDEIGGKVVIAMEYVRGQSLLEVLRRHSPLAIADAVDIVAQVCEGLAFAHAHRTIHRDVKPANILVGHDGVVKLVDFGLAEVLGTHSLAGGAGTYAYMAPEDFHESEQSGRQSDIWAAGVVLYETLAGRRPFVVAKAKDPFAWKRAIEGDPLPPLAALRPDVSPALEAIVARALARDRAVRYADAGVLARDLHALAGALARPNLSALETDLPQNERETGMILSPSRPEFGVQSDSLRDIGGDLPTAALSAAPSLGPDFPPAVDIDGFLQAAPDHWEAAEAALTTGRLARWLQAIGEAPLAALAGEIAREQASAPEEKLRDFLYRAGIETVPQARRSFAEGERAAQHGDLDTAIRLLRRAVHLDPSPAVYRESLARALRAAGEDVDSSDIAPASPLLRNAVQVGEAVLTPARADFGVLRQGQTRTLKVVVRSAGRGVVQGRVASAPGWVRVEPAAFSTRQRQSLLLTASADSLWLPQARSLPSPGTLEDAVVLDMDGVRQTLMVSASVLPTRRGFWQVALWYAPLLFCCLLPLLAGSAAPVLAQLSHTTHGHLHQLHNLWQPGAVAAGLLCGALFVLASSADTVWGLRLLPLALLCLCVGRFAAAAPLLGSPREELARMALVQTSVPILVLLILQAVAATMHPQRWGRWQVWRWIVGATGLFVSYALLHIG